MRINNHYAGGRCWSPAYRTFLLATSTRCVSAYAFTSI